MKKKYINLVIIYGLIVLYFIFNLSKEFKGIKTLTIIYIAILSIAITIIIRDKEKIEKKFKIVAVFFGIALLITIPVLHGIDEGAHFFKVYSIFNGVEKTFDEERKFSIYSSKDNI